MQHGVRVRLARGAAQFRGDMQDALDQDRQGNELKLVWPQAGVDPARFESLAFERFLLQPMDGPDREASTRACIDYCLSHPRWRLSLQTHKYLGIP